MSLSSVNINILFFPGIPGNLQSFGAPEELPDSFSFIFPQPTIFPDAFSDWETHSLWKIFDMGSVPVTRGLNWSQTY